MWFDCKYISFVELKFWDVSENVRNKHRWQIIKKNKKKLNKYVEKFEQALLTLILYQDGKGKRFKWLWFDLLSFVSKL